MSADKFERFRRYVLKMDSAIQGAGGRGQAFKVCSKAYAFKLGEDEAWGELLEWDKTCSPSWASTNELNDLRGILTWVYRNPSKPFGCMIDERGGRPASLPKAKAIAPPVEMPAPVALPTEAIPPSRAIMAAFEQGELIRVHSQVTQRGDSWMPKGFGSCMKREQVVGGLDAEAILGNKDAGIYMGQNPIRPGLDEQTAAKDEGVAAYRHALVEFDSASLEQQFAVIQATRLPVSAVVYSGGKSLHAWVRVDAPDLETYRQRVGVIHALPLLAAAGMDKANKNPSRLTRLPGARRKDKVQRVVAVNVGAASWGEWQRSQEQATPAEEPKATEDEERGRPFEVMGYDEEAVVFYLNDLRMERRVKLDELAKMDKLRPALAKESFWKDKFGKGDDLKWSAVEAAEWLRDEAARVGRISGGNLADRKRGRGIWNDAGHFVANLGNRVEVDGRPAAGAWRSPEGYRYESGDALEMAQEAATDEEAQAYVELLQAQSGHKDGGLALAGLVANAFLLGCIHTRPSAWIDGQRGVGKTQLKERCLRGLGRWVVTAESATEASIRMELKADALMVVCDEQESDALNELAKLRTIQVVELVRKSFDGDGARTSRGTPGGKGALVWRTRTCGLFSSINDGLNLDRDTQRFVQVRLPIKREAAFYKREVLPIEARCIARPAFSARLARRAYGYAAIHKPNQDKLRPALEGLLSEPRLVDKFSSLLAGAVMLTHGRLLTDEEARVIVEGFDLSAFNPNESVESNRLLERLLSSQLDAGAGDKPTVRELLHQTDAKAVELLGRAGLFMHSSKGLCVAYTAQGLLNLLPDSPWNKDSKRVRTALLAAAGKEKAEKVRFQIPNATLNAVAIPLEVLTDCGLDPF
jgi:hypothetical protein